MTKPFATSYTVRWSDLDANGHMKNTAYIECAIQTRMSFFAENGFPYAEFKKQQFGPVLFHEEISYYKEIHMHETIRTTIRCTSLSDDGGRFTFVNTLYKEGEVKAAELTSTGAWLDLNTRKLTAPPAKLHEIIRLIYVPMSDNQ